MKRIITIIALFWSLSVFGQTAQDCYNKGNEKVNAKDYSGSIKDFDEAIKLDPNYIDAYYNRGTAKMYLLDYDGSIKDFDKAIDLNPDFTKAYSNRGIAKIKSDDPDGAIEDFNIAIKLDPTNAANYLMRGQIKLQTGDENSSCDDFTKSKELGDERAGRFIEKFCTNISTKTILSNEFLKIDWPDDEGWKVANQEDNAEQKMIELLRNDETFENWSEIGTMFVFKNFSAAMKIPINKTMDIMYDAAKKKCPSAEVTFIEKDENTKYPWIIFKIECSSNGSESQVWFAIQGTNEMFVNFRAVKQKTIPSELENKWVRFFKTAKIVVK